MRGFENTFVRDASPSYSQEVASENAESNTLPIGVDALQYSASKYYNNSTTKGISARQERSYLFFWAMIIVMLLSAVGNLILTLTIMGALRLGKGIQGMELIPEMDVVKFYGNTDLDRIYLKGASSDIEGFLDVPVSISAEAAAVHVRLQRNGQSHDRLVLDKTGMQLRGINNFEIRDPISNNNIFSTHRPHYIMPTGAQQLKTKLISASRVSSAIDQPLKLESDNNLSIKGSEGIMLEASSILLQAEHNILLNVTQGAFSLEAGSGIFLDMDKVPIVSPELGLRTGSVQYKICACMPQGILFRIPIPRVHNAPKLNCAHYNAEFNPCAIN